MPIGVSLRVVADIMLSACFRVILRYFPVFSYCFPVLSEGFRWFPMVFSVFLCLVGPIESRSLSLVKCLFLSAFVNLVVSCGRLPVEDFYFQAVIIMQRL